MSTPDPQRLDAALEDVLGDLHARLTTTRGIRDVSAGVILAVADDGAFDYVLSTHPTDEAIAKVRPGARANLATRLRELADRLDPADPAAPDLAAAVNVVHQRAKAAGMAPGANRGVDLRPVLAGTDVDADQLHGLADYYAHQVAQDLAALRDDSDDAADDFLGILASFWKHAATTGVIAAQEARQR